MLGGKELELLRLQKQALIAESEVNRLTLQTDVHNLCLTATQIKEAIGRPGKVAPLLLVLAPLARLFLRKKADQSASWLSRVMTAAEWFGPLYNLWKGFAAGRRKAEDS